MRAIRPITQAMLVRAICIFASSPICQAAESANPGTSQVRDVDVLRIKKIPSKASGYCYGERVMYAHSHFSYPLWEVMSDTQMRPWKIVEIFPLKVEVPAVGSVNTAALDVEVFWDLQHEHASFASEPTMGRPAYVNEEAPGKYNDDARYTTPAGLNLVMR